MNKGKAVDLRLLTNEEKIFISKVADKLHYDGVIYNQAIDILNDFFRIKFTSGDYELSIFQSRLNAINEENASNKSIRKAKRIKQLNFLELFDKYSDNPIVENCMAHEDIEIEYEAMKDGGEGR